ncbi:nucleolar 10 isoform X1 [Cryptosporidium sp. chipmunk genotype I]|uniref:nucleolar 10 isoform X1 n=1 Tax=Cryptosporidium sp. chipmunk genotype I TaxID=1280935 RepID=UPI00351A5CB7|nr:nucleolar 10 isoform X1 [Cryptosporidium sp. chipmunk genotype I]
MYHVQYTLGGQPIYDFSRGKSLPEYLEDAKKQKKSIRHESEFRNRVEILQNFDFSVASSRIRVSPDKQFIAGIGTYPPELRMFDIKELSMKFMRRFDFEVHDFIFLSEDYKKLAFLMTDRVIEFHSQGGRHCRIRVPKQGRSMEYLPNAAELFIFGSTNEVYRLDLESGMFLAPLETNLEYINTGKISSTLPLLLLGGERGKVELWDLRDKSMAASLKIDSNINNNNNNNNNINNNNQLPKEDYSKFDWFNTGINSGFESITTSTFSKDGLRFTLGLSSGNVVIYDVRSSKPLQVKSHRNDLPIMDLHYTYCHDFGKDVLVTADRQNIKIWDELCENITAKTNNNNNGLMATINSDFPISSICTYPDSGLIMATGDQSRIGMYYAPMLGIAPSWCSFLDSITEELEEEHLKKDYSLKSSRIYDEYQFVTQEQLKEWGVEHLIGSSFLNAYLHGYLMNSKLFNDLRDIINPFDYDKYRKDLAKKKLQEKSSMRMKLPINNNKQISINNNKNISKYNQEFAEKLGRQARGELESSSDEDNVQNLTKSNNSKSSIKILKSKQKLKKGQQERAQSLLSDDRFSKLFSDADFIIDGNEIS